MASKTGQEPSSSVEDVEELLDTLDKTLDRLKTLYEQYFLGIQKQAPAYIHSDVERKLRDLMQLQIRNTGLRYRLNSIQAKFGAYNSYWRRTLRQIENGTYIRNLSKIGRAAARSGADIPEEILAAMPKRMREQVLKDRDAAIAAARRHKQLDEGDEMLTLDDEPPAMIKEGTELRRQVRGAHVLKAEDADFDLDAFFQQVESGDAADDRTPPDQPPAMPAAPARTEPAPVRAATMAPPPRTSSPALRTPTGPFPAAGARQPTGPVPSGPTRESQSGALPRMPTGPVQRQPTGPVPADPTTASQSGALPRMPTGPVPAAPTSRSQTAAVPRMQTGPVPRQPTGPVPAPPTSTSQTGAVPRMPTGPVPAVPNTSQTGAVPRMQTGPVPAVPNASQTGPVPRQPTGPVPAAPSQGTRPNPIAPGAAAARGDVPVESMAGPFPRAPQPPSAQPPAPPVPRAQQPQASQPIPRPPVPPATPPRAATTPGMPAVPAA
ncbi:MAG: hypothetical protein JO257_18850, partial [Deltaproteobacteria bacterium]|nr:hypothetical protein [Deltaproteobacteria bacterium]